MNDYVRLFRAGLIGSWKAPPSMVDVPWSKCFEKETTTTNYDIRGNRDISRYMNVGTSYSDCF